MERSLRGTDVLHLGPKPHSTHSNWQLNTEYRLINGKGYLSSGSFAHQYVILEFCFLCKVFPRARVVSRGSSINNSENQIYLLELVFPKTWSMHHTPTWIILKLQVEAYSLSKSLLVLLIRPHFHVGHGQIYASLNSINIKFNNLFPIFIFTHSTYGKSHISMCDL